MCRCHRKPTSDTDLSPDVPTPPVHLLFSLSTERDVSHTAKGHRRATGTRPFYSGKASCCSCNFFVWQVKCISPEGGKGLGTKLILAEQTFDNVLWETAICLGRYQLQEILMALKISALVHSPTALSFQVWKASILQQ